VGGGGGVTGLSKYLKMCVARGAIRVEFFSIHASFTIVLFDSLRSSFTSEVPSVFCADSKFIRF
jgi:hypothetical protein